MKPRNIAIAIIVAVVVTAGCSSTQQPEQCEKLTAVYELYRASLASHSPPRPTSR